MPGIHRQNAEVEAEGDAVALKQVSNSKPEWTITNRSFTENPRARAEVTRADRRDPTARRRARGVQTELTEKAFSCAEDRVLSSSATGGKTCTWTDYGSRQEIRRSEEPLA